LPVLVLEKEKEVLQVFVCVTLSRKDFFTFVKYFNLPVLVLEVPIVTSVELGWLELLANLGLRTVDCPS
jgi:hypothetical protein